MLSRLREQLQSGPVDTKIGIHGVKVMLVKDVRIEDADEVGVSLRLKDGRSYGSIRLHPWPSIMFIDMPTDDK